MSDSIPAVMLIFFITAGYMLVAGFATGAVAMVARNLNNRLFYGALSCLGFSGGAYQVACVYYYQADTIAAVSSILTWQVDFAIVAIVCTWLLLVLSNLGLSCVQRYFPLAAIVGALLIVANHASSYSLHFDQLRGVKPIALGVFSRLQSAEGHIGLNGYMAYGLITAYLLSLAWLCIPVWKQVSRRKGLLSLSYIGLLAATVLVDFLIDLAVLDSIYTLGFAFSAFVLVQSIDMAIDAAHRSQELSVRERQMQGEVLQRRKAEEKLRRLSQVFMQAPLPTHIIDLAGRTLQVNEESVRYLRRDASLPPKVNFLAALEALGLDRDTIVDDLSAGKVREYGPYFFSAGVPVDSLFVVRDAWLKFKLYPIVSADRQLQEMVVRIEDVTEQQFVENAIKTISMAVSAETGHAFFTQIVVYLARLLNKKYVFIGLKKQHQGEEYIETLAAAVDGELSENFQYKLCGTPSDMVLRSGSYSVARQVQRDFPGQPMLQQLSAQSYLGAAILDEAKAPIGVLAVVDIKPMEHVKQLQQIVNIFVSRAGTELQRLEAEKTIRKMAYEDYLTGLPNRTALNEYVLTLLRADSHGVSSAFILLDLDHFKTINDALGHDIGDEVIRCLGQRLKQNVDQDMLVARLGGDEFAVVVSAIGQSDAQDKLDRIALRLLGLMERPVQVGDHLLDVGCTMGVVLFPDFAETAIDVFRSADIALYKAKNAGRGGYQMFTPKMREAVSYRLNIEKGLRNALQNDELALFYQPQINAEGRLVGAEALIRWIHPEQGMISPLSFIPVAEETGLINVVGQWVLESALETRKRWTDSQVPFTGHLSLNVSAWQFARPDFVDAVKLAIETANVPPSFITLEVTETAVLSDIKETIDKLAELRRFGVTIALDDFGTGYSSLAYLRDLPLDILKIDKAFVDILETSPHEPLVESMITIGKHMGLQVVAEGVETPVQLERLKALGCNMFQGYLFSKPLGEDPFIDWLNNFDEYKNYQNK